MFSHFTPKTGTEIIAYCTSCKMNLNHIIVATNLDNIVKVQCLTCKKFHGYYPKRLTTNNTNLKADGPQKPKTSLDAMLYQKLMQQSSKGQPYSAKNTYVVMDKIIHRQFGEGVVEKCIHPNKIQVFFLHGTKVLVHGNS